MGTEWGAGGTGMCPEVCGRGQRSGLFELLDGGGHLDVLSLLQPLLTLDQVVDAVHHRLHQLHLETEHTHHRAPLLVKNSVLLPVRDGVLLPAQ